MVAALILGLAGAVAAIPAVADSVLYDNTGPYSDGANSSFEGAWSINSGYWVSDSFTVGSNSTVTGADFDAFVVIGDSLTSVDWAIGTSPDSGAFTTALISSLVSASNPVINDTDVYVASFSIADVSVSSGTTYWLTLQNAVTTESSGTGWDIGNGPSVAYESYWGNVNGINWAGTNSTTFQILGNPSSSPVPEPKNLLLLGTGVAGLVGLIRRRFAKAP